MTHLSHTLQNMISNKKLCKFNQPCVILNGVKNLWRFFVASAPQNDRQWCGSLNSAKNSTGFTLIEMLVSLVIVAIIVASVYTAFDCGKNSWQVGETIVQKNQNARAALDIMSREITCALINDWDNQYRLDFYGANVTAPPATTWRTNSVGDELYFIARLNPDSASANADICEVGYYLTDEDSDSVGDVVRKFYVTDGALPANFDYEFDSPSGNGSGFELGLNVTNLDFRYYNGSSWQDTWDSRRNGFNGAVADGAEKGTLPEAVEITITVQDEKQVAEARTFKSVVYLPRNN